MDIDQARTFVEIVRAGSFIAAAETLHITQTAVTARVRNLEDQLGCRLFIRNRQGASLTENGERFLLHATQLIHTWDAAKRELPLPEGTGDIVTVGGEISLWNPLFLEWIRLIREAHPELAVRADVGDMQKLQQEMRNGVMDAALVHQPEYSYDIQVEQLIEEKLVMVQSASNPAPYIYIDWGEAFRRQHDAALPQYARASLALNLGPLALNYILQKGGSGYFRTRVVQQHLEEGRLELVPDTPEFSYPVYLMSRRNNQNPLLQNVLQILRDAAREQTLWSLES
ncbi:MAG TPA: LysR family transcriptional regulator [Methylophilaceae bacterium]|nr:LysR family transcriptional regulator [Methylophilaceae bacterium]